MRFGGLKGSEGVEGEGGVVETSDNGGRRMVIVSLCFHFKQKE